MSTLTSPSLAEVDLAAEDAVAGSLDALAAPGSFFTGAERLAIAAHARVARGLASAAPELPAVVAEAARRISVDAITTRPEHIAAWEADGHDILSYVELVAVVSLVTTIDSYRIGIGAELETLPPPTPGDPVPVIGEGAAKVNAWVPTVGIALAPTALSALPNESKHKADLGKPFYLADKVVHQYDVEPGRELSRMQMELVASRTSWLNECFF